MRLVLIGLKLLPGLASSKAGRLLAPQRRVKLDPRSVRRRHALQVIEIRF
jgi:hypothetical protein